MDSASEKARSLFRQGYNCSQSVIGAFADDIGMDFETAIKLSSSFGAGMGRQREVCGAVSAMFMIAGLKYGYTSPTDNISKTEHYKLVQSLSKEFKQKNNTIICRELLVNIPKTKGVVPEERTEKYYAVRPCEKFVIDAAEIISNYIKRRNKTMKIAVASMGTTVAGHFGHCVNFNIYEVENNQIVSESSVQNPGHKPGFLPNFLNDMGVNVIISGGMGGGAVEIFNEKNIEVVTGASGDAKAAAQNFASGSLKSTGSVCHEHDHTDECK